MEFDWLDTAVDLKATPPKEIEESFEDPFSLRILPDLPGSEPRYFNLGRGVSGRLLFSVFWTDGKHYRVVACRPMTKEEGSFFERINADLY